MQRKQTSIQTQLFSLQDTAYKNFMQKLIPSVDKAAVIGIRTPVLRKFAKNFFKTKPADALRFMQNLPHRYFEENNLHAFLIENIQDFAILPPVKRKCFYRVSITGQPATLLSRRYLKNTPMPFIKKSICGFNRRMRIPSDTQSAFCFQIILMSGLRSKC